MSRLERFLAKVRKTRGCWWWLGCGGSQKRARMYDNGRARWAAQISYELFKGPLNGLCVLHTCDNPQCVNPKHLYLGTLQDNSNDMVNRGRSGKGTRHSRVKLTEKQVLEIRRRYVHGNGRVLGREYGLSKAHISYIVNRKVWQHI